MRWSGLQSDLRLCKGIDGRPMPRRTSEAFARRCGRSAHEPEWRHALLGLAVAHGNQGSRRDVCKVYVAPQQQRRPLNVKDAPPLSASVLAFASGIAVAETTLSTGQWLASDVYKASVYDPSENKIGNVTDLMIDSNGTIPSAADPGG